MTEARLDVVIGSAGAVSGGNAVNRAIDQVKNNFIDLAAKVFVAQQALTQVWRSAKQGAEFEETLARLNRQMGQFNSTGQLMITSLKSISGGQLSIAQSAQLASRALAVGLNPDQIKTFTSAAEVLGDVMGTDIPSAFDQLVQAATTGRGQVLANIGVYVDLEDEARKLAVSTGRTTEQITRQERAMLAVKAITEQADDAMRKMSDGLQSEADRLAEVEAEWDDLWHTISLGAKDATLSVLDFAKTAKKELSDLLPDRDTRKQFLKQFVPDFMLAPSERKGFAEDPAVREGVLGRAIVQDSLGNQSRNAAKKPPPIPGLPISLQVAQLEAQRGIAIGSVQGDFDRESGAIATRRQLVDADLQRGLASARQAAAMQAEMRVRELTAQREMLDKTLVIETESHGQIVKLGFETTEKKIGEEIRFTDVKAKIGQQILKNQQDLQSAELLNEQAGIQAEQQMRLQAAAQQADEFQTLRDMTREGRAQDLRDAEQYYQGQIDLANGRLASDRDMARLERQLLREQLAFKLQISREEADQLMALRQSGDQAGANAILGRADPRLSSRAREGIVDSAVGLDQEKMERENGDFFSGWARGMRSYVRNTESAFGFAQDMARRTAQTMEQGFQQMFFQPMEQGWQGMLDGLLNMTKQIVSQIAAQLVTSEILNLLGVAAGGVNGLFGNGASLSSVAALAGSRNVSGINVRAGTGFATGGVGDFGSGTNVTLHGREGVVPLPDGRSIPVMFKGGGLMPSVSMPVTIINQAGADVETKQSMTSDGMPQLEVLVTKAVNRSLTEGRHDKALRSRFGLTPGER